MFVFFKQKTAYDMRISDWSSDVCSSDLNDFGALRETLFTFDWGEHTFWHNLVPRSPDSAVDLRWVIALALVGLVLSLFFRIRAGWLIGAFVIVAGVEIGRASCRERVCQYVEISVGAVSLKKKNIE